MNKAANLILERSFAKVLLRFGYNMFQPKDPAMPIDILPMLVRKRMEQIKSGVFSFMHVGANDGILYDPIRPLVTQSPGWNRKGVLVEPNPEVFAALKANYEGYDGLSFECVAITDENNPATMYVSDGLTDELALSSLDRNVIALSMGIHKSKIKEIAVTGTTLDSLFKKHALANVDLFVTNTEGYDHALLCQLFSRTHVLRWIVRFEHSLMTRTDYAECTSISKRHGYEILQVGTNTLASRKSLKFIRPLPL